MRNSFWISTIACSAGFLFYFTASQKSRRICVIQNTRVTPGLALKAATIDDLDEVAIAKAEEVNKWTTEEFLSKCELMVDGKLRRAAIILLGKMFSDSKLRSAVAEVK